MSLEHYYGIQGKGKAYRPYFCPHCNEKFKPWRDGLNISCKNCYEFYEGSETFRAWKSLRSKCL